MKSSGKERKAQYWGLQLKKMQKQVQDNHYIIARGNAQLMKELKYWRIKDYYALLEQINIEAERNKDKKK